MPLARSAALTPLLPRFWLPLALLYTAFVIYGSLVPLDFKPMPWDEAVQRFTETPYLELGLEARADWVANIVLYVPLTFLWQGIVWPWRNRGWRWLSWIPVFGLGCLLAVAIEFTQLFFPPRTVSLNDLIAETTGSALGVALWYGLGNRIAGLWKKVFAGGPNASRALALLYVLGYLALALFPYDFLVSTQEFAAKLESGLFRPWMAQSGCGSRLHCGFKLIAEIVAIMPLGLLLAMSVSRRNYSIVRAFLIGAGLGLIVECAQFFIASGVSQGISVLTRGIGVALGAAAYIRLSALNLQALSHYSRTWVRWAALPYLLVLMSANGWFTGNDLSPESALARLAELNFIPFYYHYYTTEMRALSSALVVTAMYLPIGLACWLWSLPNKKIRGDFHIPFLFAGCAAFIIESGKLFIETQRPDPTNVLLGAFAAALTYALVMLVTRKNDSRYGEVTEPNFTSVTSRLPIHARMVPSGAPGTDRRPAGSQRAMALLLLALAAGLSFHHPAGLWIVIPLAAYVTALYYRPSDWMVFILAALPVLDLTPWSGWFFFDEFDLLLLATVAVLELRQPTKPFTLPVSRKVVFFSGLWLVSCFISLLAGLWPLQAIDQNAFASYYSHYNALRTGKGLLWAVAFLPFIAYAIERGRDLKMQLAKGMALGLTGVAVIVLWERHTFAGLLDFTSDYRVSGNFSGMHVGGAQIDAYLALALPFSVLQFMQGKRPLVKLLNLAVFIAAVYAMLVTFSRGALAALAVLTMILTMTFGMHWIRNKLRHALMIFVPILVMAGIALPVMQNGFMQFRLEKRTGDLQVRLQHWQESLRMLNSSWHTVLFGAGVGQFPSLYFLNSSEEERQASFRYMQDKGNAYLRLGTGRPVYFEQDVAIRRGQNYLLLIDVRSAVPNAQLDLFVCNKWIVYSSRCTDLKVQSGSQPDQWEKRQIAFNSGEVGSLPWHTPVPVKLSLRNLNQGILIDTDNIQLLDQTGRDLVENGDFSKGNRRWFFTADDHLPWHVFNAAVHIIFEQGWAGLIAFTLLIGAAFAVVIRQSWNGQWFYIACLASMTGFLVVGLFDSLFDSPRLNLLFYLLLVQIFVNSAKTPRT